ncbi:hypothetical protein C0J52_26964 [Blattella germanica]|nr:hypothetical protein C0J52_26964 [Blattella germanica]
MSISSTCGSGMSCDSVACHKASRPSRVLNGNYLYVRCTSVMHCINTVCSVGCV